MKKYDALIVLCIFLCIGYFSDPFFVDAGGKCYVDEKADDDGDGSDDEPYEDIKKALEENCDEIVVIKGTYDDDITIGKDVHIIGKSRDEVIITGKVTMKDGASIEKSTVSGRGIVVTDGADVDIKDMRIKNSRIGIETTGGGKITVDDCVISGNGKGLYIQKGKSVKITDNDISDNDEEGLDLRSDINGTISGNMFENNGESGIEVILGKADLLITNNKIKKNKASGIATQYYKGTGKSGAVKIKNNTITDNADYGIKCGTPSGGNPGKDFWDATLNMSSNKVSGNKKGDFAEYCALPEDSTLSATMTKQQKDAYDQEQLAIQRANQQREQEQNEQQLQEQQDALEKDREREEEQMRLREQLQRETELQTLIMNAVTDIDALYQNDVSMQGEVMKRSSFVMFLIGPDRQMLNDIESKLVAYDEKILMARSALSLIDSENIRVEMETHVADITKKREDTRLFIEQYNNEFSLFGWLFNRKK